MYSMLEDSGFETTRSSTLSMEAMFECFLVEVAKYEKDISRAAINRLSNLTGSYNLDLLSSIHY